MSYIKSFWRDQVASQRQWIADHGGDLAGYLDHHAKYRRTPEDVQAIYLADMAALAQYEDRAGLRPPSIEPAMSCQILVAIDRVQDLARSLHAADPDANRDDIGACFRVQGLLADQYVRLAGRVDLGGGVTVTSADAKGGA
jgi:hypothetical protein